MKKKFYGKWKKVCAAVLAAGMLVTSCPADVFAAQGDPGNGCLKVYNRGAEDGGPGFNLTGKLTEGETYVVSLKVMYIGGADTRNLKVWFENRTSDDQKQEPKEDETEGQPWPFYMCRASVGDIVAKKGEWVTFSADYTAGKSDSQAPFGTVYNKLFIETPYGSKDLDDYYIDDVVVKKKADNTVLWNEDYETDEVKAEPFGNASIQRVTEGEEKETQQDNKDRDPNNGCLGVLNRTAEGNGVGFKVDGLVKDGETTYTISAQVIYLGGDDTRTINMTIQGGPDWQYRKIVKAITAKKGEWVSAKVSNYVVPDKGDAGGEIDINNFTLFFETPNAQGDVKDFYIDDVVVMKNGQDTPLLSENFESGVGSAKVFQKDGDAEIKQLKESDMKEVQDDPQYHDCIEGTTLVSGALKAENNNTRVNPLFDYKMGADPYAIAYDGRVYVYMTNDTQHWERHKNQYGYPNLANNFQIDTLNVFSSADMVNWTDHGEISVAGKGFASLSWAPAACHKKINGKEKFFLYFANGGNGIGVLESDSPIGPFEAPKTEKGSALITRNDSQSAGVEWLFDPAVLVDDDGTGYLYYGGGVPEGKDDAPQTIRVVKLKDNMVEVDGDAVMIDAPAAFEDSGIHKHNGKYYYTYCSNFTNNLTETGRGNICAMVSDNPMTGFTYAGIVFENPQKYFGVGGNNHHCFFEFNGKSYFTYHAQTLSSALGFTGNKQSGFRSVHIDEVSYDEAGNIVNVIGTWAGSAQVKDLDPYERVEAETIAWSKGIKADVCSEDGSLVKGLNMKVTEITNGDYLAVSNADFGTGSGRFIMHVAGLAGGTVELHLDGTAGKKVGEVQVPKGDGKTWTDVSCITDISGKHSLYLVFKGGEGQLMYADYWKFNKPLTSEQKSQVDNVINLINKIGTVSNSQTSKDAIDAARKAYNELTAEQKEYVTNAGTLTAAENTYQEIKDKDKDNNTVKKGQSYNLGDYQYKVLDVSKKTVAVTKALKASKTIKVPNTVKIKGTSYKVAEIAKNAFKNNKKAETVTIGKNVTKIGANAFSGSKKLKKVTINSTVLKTIDKQAFYNCKKLATVKIVSKKLKTVAKQSFKGTAKKIKVDVPNNMIKAYKKLFKKQSGISSKAVYK